MLIPYEEGDRFNICLWAEDDGACGVLEFLEALRDGGKRERQDYQTLTEQRVVICTHGFHKSPSNRGYRTEIDKAKNIQKRHTHDKH